ncbi:unnamed protein product [Arctia plantaginis]|uniref:Uncharacterized protein n=1 Tax=Arctia plantaginis TaxID=874455 RepID=A0A8S1A5H2_ARCPL|nr:unnamed protein product [Arctia plantaginis]
MAGFLFLVLMQFIWSFGPAQAVRGGGAYSYSDSSGHRYSGTYDLKPDGQIVHSSGDPVPFSDTALPGYGYGFNPGYQGDDFYPTYFSNLENLLQEVFQSNIENQRLAYNAARKAFDLSSNEDYFNHFASRLPPFHDFNRFREEIPSFPRYPNFAMPNFPNSAFASSSLGPGFRRQIAAINPQNPLSNNVNINKVSHFSDSPGRGGYYGVSSKSYASSSNVNGQEYNRRGAVTTIDDNGKVTSYKVES